MKIGREGKIYAPDRIFHPKLHILFTEEPQNRSILTIKEKPRPQDKALFVCVHNSARSQLAEAFLKQLAGDRLEVESAGFGPAPINPLVVAVMNKLY